MHLHSKLAEKLGVALAPPTIPGGVAGGIPFAGHIAPPPPSMRPGVPPWTMHLEAGHIQEDMHGIEHRLHGLAHEKHHLDETVPYPYP